MTYKVQGPTGPNVDPSAQAALQSFFDSMKPTADNLPPFLDVVNQTAGGSVNAATALYFIGELAAGLATVGAASPMAPYFAITANYLANVHNALAEAGL